jgi:hypothetical protein
MMVGVTAWLAGVGAGAGAGKVTSTGSSAATQSPCTAPAPSTQSGKVNELRSVTVAASIGAKPTQHHPPLESA